MKVKIYVNWGREKIVNEENYRKIIAEDAKDKECEEEIFDEYLYNVQDLSHIEIFNLSDKRKEEIKKAFAKYCETLAKEEADENWEELEVEV